ncbi:hypothetical protein BGZ82_004230, partial [Podila clonocystis]
AWRYLQELPSLEQINILTQELRLLKELEEVIQHWQVSQGSSKTASWKSLLQPRPGLSTRLSSLATLSTDGCSSGIERNTPTCQQQQHTTDSFGPCLQRFELIGPGAAFLHASVLLLHCELYTYSALEH